MSKGRLNLKSKVKTANVEITTKSPVGLQVLWLIDGHSFKAGALKWCIDLIQSGCMEKRVTEIMNMKSVIGGFICNCYGQDNHQ